MSTWPTFYLILFWLAVGAAAGALIALPFVYRRGMREIDRATRVVFDMKDHEQSVSNVRRLKADELHRRMMRQRGGAK